MYSGISDYYEMEAVFFELDHRRYTQKNCFHLSEARVKCIAGQAIISIYVYNDISERLWIWDLQAFRFAKKKKKKKEKKERRRRRRNPPIIRFT